MLRAMWRLRAVPAVLLSAAVAAGAVVVTAGSACGSACPAWAVTAAAARQPSTTPGQGAADPESADALVQPIDALRIRSGCRPLVDDDALRRSATARATALAQQGGVSHVDSVGGTAQDRAARLGYRGNVVELVATGALYPEELSAALVPLMNRTDLLDCRLRSVGAAVVDSHLVMVLGDS